MQIFVALLRSLLSSSHLFWCCAVCGIQFAWEKFFCEAFLLRTFFWTQLFSNKQLCCCADLVTQTASEKMFCEACCAVSKAPLSFSAKTFFFDPIGASYRVFQKKRYIKSRVFLKTLPSGNWKIIGVFDSFISLDTILATLLVIYWFLKDLETNG